MLIERLAQMHNLWGNPSHVNETSRYIDHTTAAMHQFLQAVTDTADDRKLLFTQSQQSRRKAIKLSYLLLASETDPESAREAFLKSGLFAESQKAKIDTLIWSSGTHAIARGIHPAIAFLIMTAHLGSEIALQEYRWLQGRSASIKVKLDEYIVPGDLMDIIEEVIQAPLRLQRAIRIAGMPLTASAFAGCSLYYIDKALAFLGPIGALILSEMIVSARKRLVSDEITTAQQAFVDLYSLEKAEETEDLEEEPLARSIPQASSSIPDPELTRLATKIVMTAEAKILKATLSSMSDAEIASLLRCLEALAHERLLSLISTGRQKRVLLVIQRAESAPSGQMLRDAQLFAQKLLAAYAPKSFKPGEVLSIPDNVKVLISSLLSKE